MFLGVFAVFRLGAASVRVNGPVHKSAVGRALLVLSCIFIEVGNGNEREETPPWLRIHRLPQN
jgi:hypothetical protein